MYYSVPYQYIKKQVESRLTDTAVEVFYGHERIASHARLRGRLGASEGASESKECWRNFLVSLRERGLKGVRLFTSDKHLGFLESASEVFPDAKWQRCTVHFSGT